MMVALLIVNSRAREVIIASFVAVALLVGPASAGDVILTRYTLIDCEDMTYEGEDIVVDGSVLTLNGSHAFNSLTVINGGVVTHSAAPAGQSFHARPPRWQALHHRRPNNRFGKLQLRQ